MISEEDLVKHNNKQAELDILKKHAFAVDIFPADPDKLALRNGTFEVIFRYHILPDQEWLMIKEFQELVASREKKKSMHRITNDFITIDNCGGACSRCNCDCDDSYKE